MLKRTERLKAMAAKNQWKEGDDVYGLPKIKTLRIKIRKEKAVKEAGIPAIAEVAPVPSEAKEAQTSKPAAAKKPEDKK